MLRAISTFLFKDILPFKTFIYLAIWRENIHAMHACGDHRQLYEAGYRLPLSCRKKFKLPCWCSSIFTH